jgi:hypothetical protein
VASKARVSATVTRAFDEMGKGMLEVARSAPEGQALRTMIERYLNATTREPSGHHVAVRHSDFLLQIITAIQRTMGRNEEAANAAALSPGEKRLPPTPYLLVTWKWLPSCRIQGGGPGFVLGLYGTSTKMQRFFDAVI